MQQLFNAEKTIYDESVTTEGYYAIYVPCQALKALANTKLEKAISYAGINHFEFLGANCGESSDTGEDWYFIAQGSKQAIQLFDRAIELLFNGLDVCLVDECEWEEE